MTSYGQTELIHTIRRCGLTSGLQLCLDAGDALSYSSGQSWLDRSGNGYDFFRGATGSAAGDDPTFNGTAGNRSPSEYWSFDGGDFFTYDSANETWMDSLHKAGAKFTIMGWVYVPGSITQSSYFWNTSGGAVTGSFIEVTQISNQLKLTVRNAGVGVLSIQMSTAVPTNQWAFIAISLTEATGANGAIFQMNGTQELFTSTYVSPATTAATATAQLGVLTTLPSLPSASRLGMFAAWEGVALTQTQLNALYQATRGRFGV